MTAMSRKFYERLSQRYNETRPSHHAQSYPMWVSMVVVTANAIAEGNPSFDRGRFMRACGVVEEVVAAAVEPSLS